MKIYFSRNFERYCIEFIDLGRTDISYPGTYLCVSIIQAHLHVFKKSCFFYIEFAHTLLVYLKYIEPRLQLQINLKQLKKNLELINSCEETTENSRVGLVSRKNQYRVSNIPFSLTMDCLTPFLSLSTPLPHETNHFFMLQRIPSIPYVLFLLY